MRRLDAEVTSKDTVQMIVVRNFVRALNELPQSNDNAPLIANAIATKDRG
jgi:hypothetical protein